MRDPKKTNNNTETNPANFVPEAALNLEWDLNRIAGSVYSRYSRSKNFVVLVLTNLGANADNYD